jgi:hypothetical protein
VTEQLITRLRERRCLRSTSDLLLVHAPSFSKADVTS